ncbi:HAD-IB family phosphatase [candidate division GN15 bacterium]|nr:HAD-IB family phosphatase [candidate division GN15 bacterium]
MTDTHYAIFCDFDGTLARRDVGYHLYHKFTNGQCDELIPDWKAGRLSTRDCLIKESAMFRGEPDEVFAFLDQFEMNPGFADFARRAERQDIPLTVISDGLDLYVHYLLDKLGVAHLPVITNHGRLVDGGLVIEFPYPDPGETGGGVCKGDRIADFRQKNGPMTVIFIGDGLSDIGALGEVDILFAKKDLQRYCDRKNIPYTAFDTFHDVTRELVTRSVFSD